MPQHMNAGSGVLINEGRIYRLLGQDDIRRPSRAKTSVRACGYCGGCVLWIRNNLHWRGLSGDFGPVARCCAIRYHASAQCHDERHNKKHNMSPVYSGQLRSMSGCESLLPAKAAARIKITIGKRLNSPPVSTLGSCRTNIRPEPIMRGSRRS
jgi:hypothetical protein